MPVPGVAVGCRAQRCNFCDVLYLGMGHAFSEIARRNALTDLGGDDATRGVVEDALARVDPILFVGGGHGSESVFTGQDGEYVLDSGNSYLMAGRIVLLHSCLTAQRLGPELQRAGALAYFGYGVEWTWVQDVDGSDPWSDAYASAFWRPALKYYIMVGQGYSVGAAHDATYAAYDAGIDEWYSSGDDYAAEIIKWLAHDRNGMTTLGDPDATVMGAGGGTPITPGGGASLIGVMAAVGVAMIPLLASL